MNLTMYRDTFFNTKKSLVVLYASIFIVMTGYGITLTVLPFYVERMALDAGATSKEISVHVGALTGVFALMQFIFSPLWGLLSDRVGRRPLFFVGLGGNAVFSILFGLGSGLNILYTARILGGIFSAAILPIAAAYVTDESSDSDRGKGMARLGASSGLGVVAGPALGAWVTSRLPTFHAGYFSIDGFTSSFFAAALLAIAALIASAYWLPESLKPRRAIASKPRRILSGFKQVWTPELKRLLKAGSFWMLLCLTFLSWFGLALFEGTFALHGQQVMKFGPAQMAVVFMVCGLVMAIGQGGIVGWFIDQKGKTPLLAVGFSLIGVGLILLMLTETMAFILIYVGVLAFGMALVIPTLATLVSRQSITDPGSALGLQTAVISLAQFAGPLAGGLLFVRSIHLPYIATAVPLLVVAIFLWFKFIYRKKATGS